MDNYCNLGQHPVGAWGIEYCSYMNPETKKFWMESRCKKHNCHLGWVDKNTPFHYSNWGDRAPLYQWIFFLVALFSFMSGCILYVHPNTWWAPPAVLLPVLVLIKFLGYFKRAIEFSGDIPNGE